MQVILREEVPTLGEVGDVVTVKAGYARNYLLPRGLAVIADERQKRRVEHEKRVIEARVAQMREGAEHEKSKLDGLVLEVTKAAGEGGKLFGSVTSMELEALLREKGFDITRRRILLESNIKQLGTYEIPVKLHRDVKANIVLHVQPMEPVATETAEETPESAEETESEEG